jgi:hypothetical protein
MMEELMFYAAGRYGMRGNNCRAYAFIDNEDAAGVTLEQIGYDAEARNLREVIYLDLNKDNAIKLIAFLKEHLEIED